MKYFRGTQFVPMKGNASMYYETDDEGTVKRFMTVFPTTGEVEKMENPPIKRLFRPELLDTVDSTEFESYWKT